MRRITLFLLFLSFSAGLFAQTSIAEGGTVDLPCGESHLFTDSNPGGNYGPNEVHQITLCADGGNAIGLEILTIVGNLWDVAGDDLLYVYDGPDASAPLFGAFNSETHPEGFSFITSVENTSGCMTLVFISNAENQGEGWSGLVGCGLAWQPFSIELTSDPQDGLNLPGYIDICPGDPVTFTVTGDYPFSTTGTDGYEQSDATVFYRWNFGDGIIQEGFGLNSVSHTYQGQFGYTAVVRVTDALGQFRTESVKVRVSTTPDYQSILVNEDLLCLGSSTTIVGGYIDGENYTGFEPVPGSFFVGGLSAGQVQLPDGPGGGQSATYTDTLFIGGLIDGAVINNASDFIELCVNIEHSYIGDLEIGLICPDGSVGAIMNVNNNAWATFPGGCGAGGTYLGDANDGPAGSGPGIGFDYCWSMDAEFGTICQELQAGNTVPVNTFQNGNAMTPGTYTPAESFDAFVGCPVNGPWVLFVVDNLAADDGYIFEWSMVLNTDFFPEPETYLPEIVDAYWSPSPSIVNDTGLEIEVQPETEGFHFFEFVVEDNFGCLFDTVVSVQVVAPPVVDAGGSVFAACEDAQLNGVVNGQTLPQCNTASGVYTYCYGNSENSTWTYCPDNAGDGVTFLTLTFESGFIENFFDAINVYDGNSTAAPLIAGPLAGNMAGLTFTASLDGCITFTITSDLSVSCASGSFAELVYEISCGEGPGYVLVWEPGELLDNPNVSNPFVLDLDQDTEFTFTAYPAIAPQCVASDQVMVFAGEVPSPGEDAEVSFCFEGPEETLFDYLAGSPDEGGEWTDPAGLPFDGVFNPSEHIVGDYTYAIPACDVSAVLTVDVLLYAIEVADPDTTICLGGSALLSPDNADDAIVYFWSTGEVGTQISVAPSSDAVYTLTAEYGPGCVSEPVTFSVFTLPILQHEVTEGGNICPGDSLEVSVITATGGLEPYTFTWTSDFGATLEGSTVTLSPEQSGEWCCTLTDACETTAHVVCINIEVAEEVDATFVSDTLGGCVPASVSFFGNAENPAIISSALWEFGNGNVSTNPQVGVTSYNQQGLYSITYSVTTVDGCFFTHTEEDLITIYNEPVASFGIEPQVIVLPNTSAAFTNYALGSDTFTWVFNQADTLNSIDASYEFPDVAGVYPVTLFASNPWGCADSTTRFVVVVDSFTMYVPNAFTPDQDGINDVWRFTGIDVDEDHFELLIFNRWGEVVHRTNDYRAGWNGNVNNGSHYVPDGVYFYRIETRSKTTQDNKVVSGHITIIR